MNLDFNTLILALTTILTIESAPPLPGKKPSSVPKCVVDTVWAESRGESLQGQLAVAHTIYNRVEHPYYGKTPCEVVTKPWQFAYSQIPTDTKGYNRFSNRLRKHLITNTNDSIKAKSKVGNSLYFISKKNLDELPNWYYKKEVTATIEGHTFLK